MKINGNRWALACLGLAVMTGPAAFSQQQPKTADPYQGVSTPPPDDAIVASPDTPPSNAPSAVHVKPSPEVSVPPPPPATTAQSYSPPASTGTLKGDARYDNTDYGIVTVPGPNNSQTNQDDFQVSGDGAVLHTRQNYNPDNDIVMHVPDSANELPEGTNIRVRIDNELSTTDTTVGAPFRGQVMVDVLKNGSVIIPAGSTLRGRVVEVRQGHHFGLAATLRLRPDVVILPDGTAYHLYAQVYESEAAGTRTGSEGGIEPSAHVVKKTVEYGVGVGTGALVGAELAGPPGALAGSLVGAGLVTTHLLTQHPTAAEVPAGSEIIFSLTEPMDLTPTRN